MDIKTNSFAAWLLAARPRTLTASATPVILGLALAARETNLHISWVPAILCLLFALIMQVDANFVNDYFDYRRGNDSPESRMGPPRACTMGWISPSAMQCGLAITTVLACVVGLPLVLYGGWQMLLVGAACVVFCFLYTTIFASIGLGDLLVVVFFGLVPVLLTFYLQTGYTNHWTVILAVACGLVIDNLLIVNNYRDIDADRSAHKTTLVVLLGRKVSLSLYFFIGCAATFAVIVYAEFQLRAALMLVYLAFHCHSYTLMRHLDGRELNRVLATTARNNLIFGLSASATALLYFA